MRWLIYLPSSLWILNIIALGLNIFWKFAGENFVVCFLVVKELRQLCRRESTFHTGYKWVHQFTLPAETVCHIWLPPRLSVISCFLLRLLYSVNSFLQRLSVWFCFLPRLWAGSRITQIVSAGSHFFMDGRLGRMQETTNSLGGIQIWWTVCRKKISGLILYPVFWQRKFLQASVIFSKNRNTVKPVLWGHPREGQKVAA